MQPQVNIDVGRLSEPLTKLVETVSDHIGIEREPSRIRRRAQAEADAALIRTEAELQARKMQVLAALDVEDELLERTLSRLALQELWRQQRREQVVMLARDQLPEAVSGDPVDGDWTREFFNCVEDISNEQMQMLWARLLATEVGLPGSFSRRTLHVVRLLTSEDATFFELFCNYVWDLKKAIVTYQTEKLWEQIGLSYPVLQHLELIGLTNSRSTYDLRPHSEIGNAARTLNASYFQWRFEFHGTDYFRSHIDVISLSGVGLELFSLCNPEPDPAYLTLVLNDLKGNFNIISHGW